MNSKTNSSDHLDNVDGNVEPIGMVKKDLLKIFKSDDMGIDEKISKIAHFILVSQDENTSVMKKGFVGLATQNIELKEQLTKLQKELEIVSNELMDRKQKEKLIQEQKERRKNRKRLPQRQPISNEIYGILIEDSKRLSYSNSYRGTRLRLALAIMAVTGVRVSELLPLKMGQVKSLFVNHWIKIDRVKRGPSNHKAFLTREGAIIMKDRLTDFEFLYFSKDDNSYIFTAENSDKPLERESFTSLINQFIKEATVKIDGQPLLTSHSFRIGFITQLWRDTNDIEFVRQTIGHVKIDTTSRYIEKLSEEERKERMEFIDNRA
jgi:integrase